MRPFPNMRSIPLLALSLLLIPALAACGSDAGSAPAAGTGTGGDGITVTLPGTTVATAPSTTAPGTTTAPASVPVEVFFVRDERVAPATREVSPPAVARAAMTELLRGPAADEAAAGASTSIPAGTRLLGLRIADRVAEVDLSGEFASGGGSSSMLSRVAQVVYTLTGFPTVGSVRFLIDGERVDSIGGEGVIVDPPLSRADLPGQAPPG